MRYFFLPFCLLLAAVPTYAATVELRSGRVVIGRVLDVDAETVVVEEAYPGDGKRTLARGDIAPRSLYQILAARADSSSAANHQTLAGEAERLGLLAHAIAELRMAAKLDPARKTGNDSRIARTRSRVAESLIMRAEEALREGRWAEAKLQTDAVERDYSDTPAARRVNKLRDAVMRKMRESGTGRGIPEKQVLAAIRKAERHRDRGAKIKVVPGATSRVRRRLETSARHLESAWKAVGDVVPESDVSPEVARRFDAVRAEVRRRLIKIYLAIGTIHLQRRALPQAQEFNAKACMLGPDSGECRDLQAWIVEAEISGG